MGRWTAVRPAVADGALAAALTAVSLAQLARPPLPGPHRPLDVLGVALTLAVCAPLALRARAPRAVLAVMLVAAAGLVGAGYPQVGLGLPLLVGVYTVGSRFGLRASTAVLALLAAVLAWAFAVDPAGIPAADVVVTVASLAGAWWVGASIRLRREQARLVEEVVAAVAVLAGTRGRLAVDRLRPA